MNTFPYIILLKGKICLIELPQHPKDHPNFKSGMDQYSEPLGTNGFWQKQLKAYESARSAAIEKAVEVENQNIEFDNGQDPNCIAIDGNGLKEGEEVRWPGTWEKVNHCESCQMVRTRCLNNDPDDCIHPKELARLIAPEQKKSKDELIAEIRAGKLAIENDVEPDQLNEILKAAFTEADTAGGDSDYYYTDGSGMNWTSSDRPKVETTLPTIKATALLEVMEEKVCIQTGLPCGFPCLGEDVCKKKPLLDAIHSDREEPKLKQGDAGFKHFTCPTCDGKGSVPQDYKPEPLVSETQEELWGELREVVNGKSDAYVSINDFEEAKKQFTITRKS